MPLPRRFDIHAIDDLAAIQGGVVSYRQLVNLGMSSGTISQWTRTGGRWQRLLPGTYLTHRGTPTFGERLHATLQYAGADAVLTGLGALHLYGLRNLPSSPAILSLHVLISHEHHLKSHSFLTVERTSRMPEPVRLKDVSVAPLARAVFDAGRRHTSRQAIRAFTLEAVQRGRLDIEDLRREIREGQRQWTAVLRDVVGDARSGVLSVPEADLRDLVRASSLPEPLWNPRLETPAGEFIAEPDGYYEDLGIALEVDSRRHHFEDERGYENTWQRHTRFTRRGIVVIRIMPVDIRDSPLSVVQNIAETRSVNAGRTPPAVLVRPKRRGLHVDGNG